jgi:alkylated DNA repair dioxygenase AlkB
MLILEDSISYKEHFLKEATATRYFEALMKEIHWEQYPITIFGKTYLQPRLIGWYGDEGIAYRYSNTELIAEGWTPTLMKIKSKIELDIGHTFNSVLVNLYRDGQDSMGWHSDDEKELGDDPIIASVSLGAVRKLQFRKKADKREKMALDLGTGSLLVMKGQTQTIWQHQIAKTKKCLTPRINLTFRQIIATLDK